MKGTAFGADDLPRMATIRTQTELAALRSVEFLPIGFPISIPHS